MDYELNKQKRPTMEFLKKYQVAEHLDGEWSVIKVKAMKITGSLLIGEVVVSSYGYHSAAEAQELADELNGGSEK